MKLFVWDLHGTLEQGNERAVIELSNQVLADHGHDARFSETHILELYGRKWYEYFEFILPSEPHETHLALQAAAFDLSDKSADVIARHMRPAKNSLEVLRRIKQKHQQILISNTVPAALQLFIPALGMQEFFNATNAFAVNGHTKEATRVKQDILSEFLAVRSTFDDIVIIGDSGSDMQLAKDFKATSYLYAHHNVAFRSDQGMHKINDLKELLKEL